MPFYFNSLRSNIFPMNGPIERPEFFILVIINSVPKKLPQLIFTYPFTIQKLELSFY